MLNKFFEGQPSFDWDDVVVASSHGQVRRGGGQVHKVSYHLFVPGFKMTMAAMKHRLEAVDGDRLMDRTVYKSTQKLRAVGATKTARDKRVLSVEGTLSREVAAASLVQLTAEDDIVVRSRPMAGSALPVPVPSPGLRSMCASQMSGGVRPPVHSSKRQRTPLTEVAEEVCVCCV